jgi:hypothetical protein
LHLPAKRNSPAKWARSPQSQANGFLQCDLRSSAQQQKSLIKLDRAAKG